MRMVLIYKRFTFKLVVTLLLIVPGIHSGYSQITEWGTPKISRSEIRSIKTELLPKVDENVIRKIKAFNPRAKDQPFQFAVTIPVDLNPWNSGKWTVFPDGSRIWILKIKSQGAYSLNLIFSSFHLFPGAKLFLYNTDRSKVLGAVTSKNNKKSGILPTVPIPGDELVLEYHLPPGVDAGQLQIGQVGHDFTGLFNPKSTSDDRYGKSGPCNVDINCSEGADWQAEKNAVVRLIINGNELCTGVILNNTRLDATPYLLTAAHCITTVGDANQTIAVFGYESPWCNGPDGEVNHTISGAALDATSDNLDFSLAHLTTAPPYYYHPYYAGWNRSTTASTRSVSIHHPNGDVKKISMDYDAAVSSSYSSYDATTFWKILQWDIGTTEAGSSGAPLFDNNHLVVGSLSGGDASCGNSYNDYFQKFSASWDHNTGISKKLQPWLDPISMGGVTLAGFDPYETTKNSCDTLPNYSTNETLIIKPVITGKPDSGYWTGHNYLQYTQYAEKITNTGPRTLSGVIYHVANVVWNNPTDKVILKVWTGSSEPGSLVLSKTVPLSYFQDSTNFYTDFDTLYVMQNDFWIGYELFYDYPGTGPVTDQFSVFQVEPRPDINAPNTAMYFKNQWYSFADNGADAMRISLGIDPLLCGDIPWLKTSAVEADLSGQITVWPVPAGDHINITLPVDFAGNLKVHLFTLLGKEVVITNIRLATGTIKLDLPSLSPGIYFIKLTGKGFRATKKITVIY